MTPYTTPALEALVAIDREIDQAEDDGITARWRFGCELLELRVGKKLPVGLLDELSEETGKSQTELRYRALFASRFPTEDVLVNAIDEYGSWYRIVNECLASTAHLSAEKDEWATPQTLYDALDAEFHFTLDVCATAENAKAERFFTLEDDALTEEWTGACWMNPPYSRMTEFMDKAARSARGGAIVCCLVPSRTDVDWWWQYARQGEIRLLRGRLSFVDNEGNTGPAPFPSAVIILGLAPGLVWYEY